jgi:hypothetical protein
MRSTSNPHLHHHRQHHQVRFALPAEISRPARSDELAVIRAFSGHVGSCRRCSSLFDRRTHVKDLCATGYNFAFKMQRLLAFRQGIPYSALEVGPQRQSIRVEIPECYMSERGMQAIRIGFRLEKEESIKVSRTAPEADEHTAKRAERPYATAPLGPTDYLGQQLRRISILVAQLEDALSNFGHPRRVASG